MTEAVFVSIVSVCWFVVGVMVGVLLITSGWLCRIEKNDDDADWWKRPREDRPDGP